MNSSSVHRTSDPQNDRHESLGVGVSVSVSVSACWERCVELLWLWKSSRLGGLVLW